MSNITGISKSLETFKNSLERIHLDLSENILGKFLIFLVKL